MSQSPRNILLVEDSKLQAAKFISVLNESNYKVRLIGDGLEAFNYLLNPTVFPDVVIIDYNLPSLNGIEIIEKVFASGMNYAFIFFSAVNDISTGLKALQSGALDFIPKSAETTKLLPLAVEKAHSIFQLNNEKKKTEYTISAILEINARIASSSLEEIVRIGVDSALKITDSQVGFLHFIDEDNKSISLHAWSGPGMKECSETKTESHYPLDKAGVWVDCIKKREPVIYNNYKLLSHKKGLPDGHVEIERFISVPVFDNNRVAMVVGVGNKSEDYFSKDAANLLLFAENLWNIIQRKKTEETLRENEIKYRSLAENINDGIYITERGTLSYVNSAFNNIFGYINEELIGTNSWDLAKPEIREDVKNKMIQKVKNKDTSLFEVECIKKDGTIVFVEIAASTIRNDGRGYGVVRDISERKRAEQQLKTYTEELQNLNSTKNRLFSIIAHDLRNPFGNLLGFLQLLQKNIDTTDKLKREKFINLALDSARQIHYLLENLLSWSRSQMNSLHLEPEKFDIRNVVGECTNDGMLKLKNIDFINSIPEDLSIVTDQNLFKTVFRNLIQNAEKFTLVNGRIEVNAKSTENEFFISVCDNGIGMSKEKQSNIFNQSVSNSTSGTQGEKGTGLGLMLCLEFVEKMQGRIIVESELDKGTCFTVVLPLSLT